MKNYNSQSNRSITRSEEIQQNANIFNNADVGLKEWRDKNTSTHSYIEDLNHQLDELGQRGFSLKQMNLQAGQHIANLAREKGDRRYLELLDEIKTPGGVWGHTVDGMKLKQLTLDRLDADEDEKTREERAAFVHGVDVSKLNFNKEIGTLFNLRRAIPGNKQAEIDKVTKQIEAVLAQANAEGVGSTVQTYYNSMVTGIEKGTQAGVKKVRRLYEVVNPEESDRTVRDLLIDTLKNNSLTDFSTDQRTKSLNDALVGQNIQLDEDGLALKELMEKQFVPIENTPEYKDAQKSLQQEVKNAKVPYTSKDQFAMPGTQKETIPPELSRLILKHKTLFRAAYQKAFSDFSDNMESRSVEQEEVAYGYGGWKPANKEEFMEKYLKEVDPLLGNFKTEVDAFHNKQEPLEKETKSHEALLTTFVGKSEGPKYFNELHDMFYDPDNTLKTVSPNALLEQFKIGMLVLQEKASGSKLGVTKKQGEKSDLYGITNWGTDLIEWYEASVGDNKDPQYRDKKIREIWDWGLYLMQRKQAYTISKQNISDEEKKVLTDGLAIQYKEEKKRFPTDISFLSGVKKKRKQIREKNKGKAVWDERNPWPKIVEEDPSILSQLYDYITTPRPKK